ncbi:MAG: DUF3575 domain-containing protein [Bacteroidaceae bacterium]|nr:DUF3575 domain-containing protein [Bacteroidaceae bacterium]
MYKRIVTIMMGIFLLAHNTYGQGKHIHRQEHESVRIYFRQGSHQIEESYMDNKATLERFAQEVNRYAQDSTARFRQIRIVSSASPEGSKQINDRLVKQRAQAITDWISQKISTKLDYEVESTGIDWVMLDSLVRNTPDVPYRDEVLDIISNTSEYTTNSKGVIINERYNKLTKLRNGVPYQWIYNKLFPLMRYASARAEFWWETEPELFLITESPLYFPWQGSDSLVVFEKSIDDDIVPEVVAADGWVLSIVPTEGDVTFTVAPNYVAEPRTTTLTLKAYGKEYPVVINQAAAEPKLTLLTESPMYFDAEGADSLILYTKNVKDNAVPTVTCSSEWIQSLTPGATETTFTVLPNESTNPRVDTILVTCYGHTQPIIIHQEGIKNPFYMSLSTNMLYDLALVPNIGVEFYLGKNWSIDANWHYTWWKESSWDWFHRTYGGDLAIHYWFGKAAKNKPLTGHHVGAYGQMVTYDFEYGGTGYLADRWSWSVGLEYGYSMPITRRLNIDFAAGFGYHWGIYEKYLPIDGHYVWQETNNRKYLGPTKVEVSLVWLLGRGNINEKKGGLR